jgi:hypothetical protein
MFDWRTYLALAHELAQRTDEAALRAAISRAYYAAYGVACDYVGSRRVQERNGKNQGSHQQVWEVLRDDPVTVEQGKRSSLVKMAYELKWGREKADYRKHVAIKTADVDMALAKASKLISMITKLPPL